MTSQSFAHTPPEGLRRIREPFIEVAMGEQHPRVSTIRASQRAFRAVLAAVGDIASAAVLAELVRRRRA